MKFTARGIALSAGAKWLILIWLVTLPLVNPWVRGDGVGYYAYIRAVMVHGNLDLKQDWLHANPSFLLIRLKPDVKQLFPHPRKRR